MLQKASKGVKFTRPSTMYQKFSDILIEDKAHDLIGTLEVNFVFSFSSSIKQGVILGTYKSMKERFGHPKDSMQTRPDMVSTWIDSKYEFKGHMGTDQKHARLTDFGRNQVLTNIENFSSIIQNYTYALSTKVPLTPEILAALDDLVNTCSTFEIHLDVWSRTLHLFPEKWKPPLLLNKAFDTSFLQPEIVELLKKGEVEIAQISDFLYVMRCTENISDLSNETLDNLYESFIQKLMQSS